MCMKKILCLQSGAVFSRHSFTDEERAFEVDEIDLYELPNIDLSVYKCISIDAFVDQVFLLEHRQQLDTFLNERNILIFSGNIFLPWLAGAQNFIPRKITTHRDYEVENNENHPIFAGVDANDMTFKKGVSGFFARGHHPVPEGAEVLLTLRGNVPITYIDRVSSRGTILVHAGNDLLNYTDTSATTGRIKMQLMKWIDDEYVKLQEKGRVECGQ